MVEDDDEAIAVSDEYAPEHLEVQTARNDYYLERLRNYGSLFLGEESTVAYGDKGVGTNHTLPTGRAARYTGGLWVGKFIKTLTYQRLTPQASRRIAPIMAPDVRGRGHARAQDHRRRPLQPLRPAQRGERHRRRIIGLSTEAHEHDLLLGRDAGRLGHTGHCTGPMPRTSSTAMCRAASI